MNLRGIEWKGLAYNANNNYANVRNIFDRYIHVCTVTSSL